MPPKFDPRFPSVLNESDLTTNTDDPDSVLDLDEIGAGQRKTKRGAVNLEGYDSDSEGGEDTGRARDAAGGDDGEDEDMFASEDEGKGKDAEKGKGGKEVKFLDIKDIEGQEFGNENDPPSSEHASDSEENIPDMGIPQDDESEDETGIRRASKKAPKISKFNMKEEAEEGRFDEAGHFIRKARDADEVHDVWLKGIHSKDIKKAAKAHEERERERRERDEKERGIQTWEVLSALIGLLERGETPLEALARLGTGKRKREPKISWREKKAKAKKSSQDTAGGEGDVEMSPAPAPAEEKEETEEEKADRKRRETVEAITEATDRLFSRGLADIYDQPREALQRHYRRLRGEDWVDPNASRNPDGDEPASGEGTAAAETDEAKGKEMWEYRWTDNRDDGKVYGPYDADTMKAWEQHGYFAGPIEFRREGAGEGGWSAAAGFL